MKHMKMILILILCTAVLAGAFAGCGEKNPTSVPSPSGDLTEDLDKTPDVSGGTTTSVRDFDAAYAAYAPETVMFTADGDPVTWKELFFWLHDIIVSMETQLGAIADWSAEIFSGMTYSEYMLSIAKDYAIQYISLEQKAKELGVELTEEDYDLIEEQWSAAFTGDSAEYDSQEAFVAALEENYDSEDYYRYRLMVGQLYTACFENQFGVMADKLAEEDVLEYTADDGYYMAKHILLLTQDSEGAMLSAEEIAAQKETAETILSDLRAYTGDDLEAYFTEKMNEYTEDTGTEVFPSGYLFQAGQMVEEFQSAVEALEVNGLSEIVETSYGFHIIMRIPINIDVTPMRYSEYVYYGYGSLYTLRFIVANDMFKDIVGTWVAEVTPENSDEFTNINLGEIFRK